ncbi:MAG: hypothetical protein ACRC28_13100 [Clostridium sp.]|uniref:hypothetical protein n=1 Tax=Clostridium sp. TaxID=1506 RepID=UPI003F2E56F9
MRAVGKEELENIIYIEDIGKGLNNYTNGLLEVGNATVSEFKEFIKEINKDIVVDYYGNIIKDKEFELLVKTLSKKEEHYLREIREKKEKSVIFAEVEDEFLEIIIKLSYEEILFSSFYLGNAMTIWGNFNKEFVIFFEEDVEIEKIKKLAEKYNLKIKDIRERK